MHRAAFDLLLFRQRYSLEKLDTRVFERPGFLSHRKVRVERTVLGKLWAFGLSINTKISVAICKWCPCDSSSLPFLPG